MPLTLPQNFSDVLDYRHVLWKRKWTVLLCTALVLVFTAYRVYQQVPIYSSTARILLSYKPPGPLNMEEVFQQNPWQQMQRPDAGATLILLSSRMVAERVVQKLNLLEQSSLTPVIEHSWRHYAGKLVPGFIRSWIKGLFSSSSTSETEEDNTEDRLRTMVTDYLNSLQVMPSDTGLVEVSFTGTDPAQLQEILGAHLQEFINVDLEVKFETSDEASAWIEEKLEEARQRLEASELALLQYADENDIPPLTDRAEAEALAREYADLIGVLAHYRNERRDRENVILTFKNVLENPNLIESLPQMRNEAPLLEQMKAELGGLSFKYKNMSMQYGPEHPQMVRLRNQIDTMRTQIKTEARKLLKTFEMQYAHYEELERATQNKLTEIEQDMRRMNELLIQYQALQSEAESAREVYEQVLAKLNLVKLMGNMQDAALMSTIKIIDKPQPPMMTGGGSKVNKLVKAGGMGFILGIAVAFLLEFLDNVVRTPKDIQRFIALPFLGFVPRLLSVQTMKKDNRGRSFVTILDPSSSEAESIRNVRTNLIFSFADRKNHAVMFTSPNEMEGKSTVISQLAASISQLSKNTLLVDTDLRRPTLHKIMRVENAAGVSDILIGETTLDQAIHETGIANLNFLSAGTIPPNPSELLGSESMKRLIEDLKSRYDVILFDSPPILPVVDAKVLGSLMDGVCIVPRSGKTTLTSLNQAIQQMEERTIRLLGIVLNHLDLTEFATHYGYTYGYYQSTGEQEEEVSIPPATTS